MRDALGPDYFRFPRTSGLRRSDFHQPVPRWTLALWVATTVLIVAILIVRFA